MKEATSALQECATSMFFEVLRIVCTRAPWHRRSTVWLNVGAVAGAQFVRTHLQGKKFCRLIKHMSFSACVYMTLSYTALAAPFCLLHVAVQTTNGNRAAPDSFFLGRPALYLKL